MDFPNLDDIVFSPVVVLNLEGGSGWTVELAQDLLKNLNKDTDVVVAAMDEYVAYCSNYLTKDGVKLPDEARDYISSMSNLVIDFSQYYLMLTQFVMTIPDEIKDQIDLTEMEEATVKLSAANDRLDFMFGQTPTLH